MSTMHHPAGLPSMHSGPGSITTLSTGHFKTKH
uniref:Uncharacterized protein n=1 Tax=Anguilla anguilla TaxID=7936 RepID=A0A0E9U244_ANGAN